MSPNAIRFQMAIRDFQSARQRAAMEDVLARLRGQSNDLLSYEEIAQKLRLRGGSDAGIKSIPVDAIVGSVGRYTDFTRTFLPRHAKDQERWSLVKTAFIDSDHALPPVEVYQVGDAYFVLDGNHRISIARQEGMSFIDAHVFEVRTDVPLTPDMRPDDLIIQAEYAEFMETTRLMDLRPNVDLSVTVPGQYEKMLDEIRCFAEEQPELPFQHAIESWYDQYYIPLAETIRDRGLLRWFPDRTVTDLCVWISENRQALEAETGWEMRSGAAAVDLLLKKRVRSGLGNWRKARTVSRYTGSLFVDLLVPLSGGPERWDSLEQAVVIARRENAQVNGLHVVSSTAEVEGPSALAVRERFEAICTDAGIEGSLLIEAGEISNKIRQRSAAADLLVLKVTHPPQGGLSVLRSPFRSIISGSPCPVLAVPDFASQFKHAVLAYDDSPRAREALFLAAYFAEVWKTELTVLTALNGSRLTASVQDYPRRYLELHEVQAGYLTTEEDLTASLKQVTADLHADLLLIGSYAGSVLHGVVARSSVDAMLQESTVPVFICH